MLSNKLSKSRAPKILLIGAGRFGKHHLRVLKELSTEGSIEFIGAIIRNKEQRERIESEFGIKTYAGITPSLLKSVDAVDIVTTPETHFDIVKKCLPYTNVFVEKPLTTTTSDARKLEQLVLKYKRVLSVGHIFRYHQVTKKLMELLGKKPMPQKITGFFINPTSSDQGREPSLELPHLFDVVDFLWRKEPEIISARADGRTSIVNIRYSKYNDARFVLGWNGDEKKRTLRLRYPDCLIDADFVLNTIIYKKGTASKTYQCQPVQETLYEELSGFAETLLGKRKNEVDASTGARIISIAEKAIPKNKIFPSVAIIGGGIFGTSAAAELSRFCSVTIFEKNPDLMQEGTLVNCFRHHMGYHYPRSSETVLDIQNSCEDFEKVYGKAILSSYPTYYGIAKNNSHVSTKEFLAFCKKHNLPYKKTTLPSSLLSKDEIDVCIKVPEPGYHYEKLTKIVKNRLGKESNIKILCNSLITGLSLNKDGTKTVTYLKNNRIRTEKKFDFVVNATYANINQMTNWLSFDKYPLRVDLAEVLVIKMETAPISITLVDGPFATLMPTGNKNEFTLYHVVESVLDRYVPENGIPKKLYNRPSNQEAIIKESLKFFPILKDAIVTESRIVHRGVQAHHEHDDSRVVDLIDHGFGCWSILSGKILSSVTTGKRLAGIIKNSLKN